MTILETRQLVMDFGGLRALDRVDLSIQEGEIRGLIGPNGAGKTTLFNVVTGFYRPGGGRVLFNGMDITGLKPHQVVRRGIARTFQTTQLFPTMTVFENIMVGRHCRTRAELAGAILSPAWARDEETSTREMAEGILGFLDLKDKKEELACNLPYGQQRLVELGRALASEPKLLLLDEPSAGMTAKEVAVVMDIIKRLRERGLTILVVEHDMRVIMGISDIISVLNFGEKIAEGRPEEIRKDPRVIDAYLGTQSHAGG